MRLLTVLVCSAAALPAWASPVATPQNPVPDLNQTPIQTQIRQNEPLPTQTATQNSVHMTPEELLQHPDLLNNALDTAIAQSNIANIQFLLPLYRQLPSAQQDPILSDYAEALWLREQKKHDLAEAKLQGILAQNPNFLPVRWQLALTQSQNGKMREAAKELSIVKQAPDFPENMQQLVQQFEQHLAKAQQWQLDGNLYYLRENNVANAPTVRTYGNWQFDAPKSAHGLGYEMSAQKTLPIRGHWAGRINVSAYGKFYWDAHDYDDLMARVEPSLVWRDVVQEISLAPFYERRWFGGERFSQHTGGLLRYSRTLSPRWQVFGAWQSGYKKHDVRTYLDGAQHMLSLSALYQPSGAQYFVAGIGGGRSNARDLSDAYEQTNARLVWGQQWGSAQKLSTVLLGSVQQRRYRAPDFFNIQRRDTEYFTRFSLSHQAVSWKGFTPRLNWTWSRNASNHFYYRQNQHRIYLDISRQF